MRPRLAASPRVAIAAFLVCAATSAVSAQPAAKHKVFIDQDGAGPAGTDTLSVLALLQSPDVDVLGITVTAGDVWVKEGVRNMLRLLELTGHEKVPVSAGGIEPLVNSLEETEIWERQWGAFSYKGAWNPGRYHAPDTIPAGYAAGEPTINAVPTHGALLIIDAIRRYPNEVTLWVGGPFTTVALALRLDPGIAALAKELVVMGAGFNVDKGGNHRINGRREFNWWWDPEATRIAMSAPWKKITITPVDISVKTALGDDSKQAIARSQSRAAQYVTKYIGRGGGYMWDEIAAVAWLDPSIITRQQELFVNIDIDHGASYGQTIFVEAASEPSPGQPAVPRKMAPWWHVATVQWDLDVKRFYDQFVALMSK
jgi:purine nucleosidase